MKYYHTAYNDTISKYGNITRGVEKELLRAYSYGDISAGHMVVLSHIKSLYKEIRKQHQHKTHIDDIVQVGMLGMLNALPHYNIELGNRFMTYARLHIISGFTLLTFRNHDVVPIRLGVRHSKTVYEILRYTKSLLRDINHSDCIKISEKLDVPVDIVVSLSNRFIPWDIITLDEPHPAETHLPYDDYGDCLPYEKSPYEPYIDKEIFNNELSEAISHIRMLKPKYATVMTLRYLSDKSKVLTYEEIGEVMGMSRQRVSQIVIKSIKLIRQRIEAEEK